MVDPFIKDFFRFCRYSALFQQAIAINPNPSIQPTPRMLPYWASAIAKLPNVPKTRSQGWEIWTGQFPPALKFVPRRLVLIHLWGFLPKLLNTLLPDSANAITIDIKPTWPLPPTQRFFLTCTIFLRPRARVRLKKRLERRLKKD